MRNLYVRLLILLAAGCLATLLRSGTGQAETAPQPGLSVEAFVWQFDEDYGAGIA